MKEGVTMPEGVRRVTAILSLIVFVVSSVVTGTYAWQSRQTAVNEAIIPALPLVDVVLIKLEKHLPVSTAEKPISDVQFLLFKENGKQVGKRYITDENGKIAVKLRKGDYYFEEISPGVGYTFDTNEDGEKITRYYFSVTSEETEPIIVKAYNVRLTGSLIISKTVNNHNYTALTDEQKNTPFTFKVVFSDGGSYNYRIDGAGDEYTVESGNTLELMHGQTAVFESIPTGVLYNVTEIPTDGYTVMSRGHRGNITEQGATATFINSAVPAKLGRLTVTKEVIGETPDINQRFSFTATIDGEDKTFTLAAGESKSFNNIPLGAEYSVTEESTEQGFISAVNHYEGKIAAEETLVLPFVNVYDENPDGKIGNIEISKEIIGESPELNTEFSFNISFSGDTAPEDIDFTLKPGESTVISDIAVGTPYVITENVAEGYEQTVRTISGNIAGEQTLPAVFKNVTINKENKIAKLTVKKHLAGEYPETDLEKDFRFVLTVDGAETVFTLKANEEAEFEIPFGSVYEVKEDDCYSDGYVQSITDGFGIATSKSIAPTVTNTYIGEIKTVIRGTKKWQLGKFTNVKIPVTITLYIKNGNIVYDEISLAPDKNGNWEYTLVLPKYDTEENEIEYTVEEEKIPGFKPSYMGFDITNEYIAPVEVDPPIVKKIVKGENAPDAEFQFAFIGENDAPMPEGSIGNRKIMSLTGAGEIEFGIMKFDEPGEYRYTIYELDGASNGWQYDKSMYTIIFTVTEKNHRLFADKRIEKNDDATNEVTFTNVYEEPKENQTVTISGKKVWKHGTNPVSKRPTAIIVQVYADGKLAVQRQITEKNNWKYSFELSKFSKAGKQIVYTIDEVKIENYNKTIDGYDIINTYAPKPSNGNASDSIPEENSENNYTTYNEPNYGARTDDVRDFSLWVYLMIISGICILTTCVFGKRKKDKFSKLHF